MGYKVVHLVGGASPFVTIEDAVNKYVDEGWRLVAVSQGLHYFERNDGPSGRPPRYWGIYDTRTNAWLRKSNGEPYHFPAPGVAQALLDTLLVDMAHTVDGRGRSVAGSLVVKEMTPDPCITEGHQWKQWATHLNCERCNESIPLDCP